MRMRPNVLVMLPHDLGDHLGCYGYGGVRSPNLDRLAAEGARFTEYFAASPECSPSRGCMMTGLHTHQNGLMGLSNFGWDIRQDVPHLARRMTAAGYATHLFGVQHESAAGHAALGYEHGHATTGNRRSETVCAVLNDWLREQAASDDDQPWYACAGFMDVHRPWRNEPTIPLEEIEVPPYLPDTPVMRQQFALFYEDILRMDAAVGTVLETLRETGQERDTLVIFTSDHGAPFPGAKATLYGPGLRLPMIMRWPGQIAAGATPDALLSNVDFTPTLLEATGTAVPDGLAGQSFWPLLSGGAYHAREAVYGTVYFDVAYDPVHVVRTREHAYVRSFVTTPEGAAGVDPEVLTTFEAGRWIRCDDFDVLSNDAWTSLGEPSGPPPAEELYDLRAPAEARNLVDDPTAAATLQAMRARLDAWMAATDSPLLHGHVPAPPAQVDACRRYRPHGPAYQ